MGEFSADWLSVREPEDKAARNANVLDAVCRKFSDRNRVRILDIGSGTGSTMRSIAHKIVVPQDWILADYDRSLLESAQELAQESVSQPPHSVQTLPCDLNRSLDVLKQDIDLVSTSAFLDLVSEDWLTAFVGALADRGLPFYAALSYTGVSSIEPAHTLDPAVLDAFNDHQGTDKGFGPALGPRAAERAVALLRSAGYELVTGASDWNSQSMERKTSRDFQSQLLTGWAQAASEIGSIDAENLSQWLADRRSVIEQGMCRVIVGHEDIFAWRT